MKYDERFTECVRMYALLVVVTLFLALLNISCATGVPDAPRDETIKPTLHERCVAEAFRYPVAAERFSMLYAGRSFLADGVHLGHDVALTEGTTVSPIACGRLVVYRAATGYGTLVAVVEHTLAHSVSLRNGDGELVSVSKFLSIYGHIRPRLADGRMLAWREGDEVSIDDVLGTVENDARNGDGAEHLHLGMRLQSRADAERVDASWFRGYDAEPSLRRYFTDPVDALRVLMDAFDTYTVASPDASLVSMADVPRDVALSVDLAPVVDGSLDAGTTDAFDASDVLDVRINDGAVSEDAGVARDVALEAAAHLEVCNGVDDTGEGLIDEGFVCAAGSRESCVTVCGSVGWHACLASCFWSACVAPTEDCANGMDEDCNGRIDCADEACRGQSHCLVSVDAGVADSGVNAMRDVMVEPDVSHDAGTPVVDTGVVDVGGSSAGCHVLRLEADERLLGACRTGWVLILYLPTGEPYESLPGTPLEYRFCGMPRGQLNVSVRCEGLYLRDWPGRVGEPVMTGGLRSVTLDGVELADSEALLCYDTWSPTPGVRPRVPLEPYFFHRCD